MNPKTSFVIKRQITHTLLTTSDRKVLVFAKKEHAQRYLSACIQLRDNNMEHQNLKVDPILLDRLQRRCSMNSLKVCYVDSEMNMTTLNSSNISMDDMSFYLDNNMWFYKP